MVSSSTCGFEGFFALLMIYNIEDPWIRIYNIMRIYESGLRRQVPKLKNKTLQNSCFLIKKSKRLYCRSVEVVLSDFLFLKMHIRISSVL